MRRILIISGLAFAAALLLWSDTAIARGTEQQSAPKAAKVQSSNNAQQTAKGRRARASRKKGVKRPEYRSEYKQNAVEVINGSNTRRVVFDDGKKTIQTAKNQPSPLKVEVLNGGSTDTRYFYVDKNHPQEQAVNASPKRPVVVGVESSNTRGGNRQSVVTAITDASSAQLTTGVVPQPKRRAYEPKVNWF